MFRAIKDSFGMGVFFALWALLLLGDLYWLYSSIQIGSFFMFVLGLLGPIAFLTGLIGGFALLFGWPDFILSIFG
ncbi:maltose ABC transporter permease [Paracoccus shanxieyensis]|uniref:Maltose ABC transporter permease n=1 Tax=Paracoccus shanxieyensis TaxID=2675752 RepID=A0A6L6J1Q3_9RHOB|nr:maltose ABC transporter permease [Paracoccus shanxieyensis]MTH66726.1 maltose ABC transporter permease [Paracoccus shanxieyensis]MTH89961.1 maltose ABC transporter permease [Paracoccus shanxieyensis]